MNCERPFFAASLLLAAVACGTSSSPNASTSDGGGSSDGSSGATTSSSSGSSGGTGSGVGGSSGTGSSSGTTSSSSSGDGALEAGLPDGAVNMVPAGYAGTPFKTLTIPGTIYGSDYDFGGPSVAYCHAAGGTTVAECEADRTLHDWCCPGHACTSNGECGNGTATPGYCIAGFCKLCWDTVAACPPYRTTGTPPSGTCVVDDNGATNCPDNGGLSHMNPGEPDDYPDGGIVTPYFPYLSYTVTGMWFKYTVEVLEAGTYSVSGLDGSPSLTGPPGNAAPPDVRLDFGGDPLITTGNFLVPSSKCVDPATCTEGFHVWQMDMNMATVTFPAPGTYVMTFTLESSVFNPGYWTFAKM